MDKIIVLGGSFNPPTVAHLRLMQAALEVIGADRGIFVPTAHDYVAAKLKRLGCPQDVLSETIRLEMMETMCRADGRLSVSRIRTQGDKMLTYDYETLEAIQAEAPEAALYFLIGSDKLYILPRWHRVDELLARFRVLVARRGGDDIEKIKTVRPYLADHWEAFTVFDAPEEIAAVSSGLFREKLHNGDESAAELVAPEVWDTMNENGKIPWNCISDFHQEPYGFLSNFYEAEVAYGGLVFGSNEAAFQAQKCTREDEKAQFAALSPAKSKSLGRRVQLRPDWEQVKTGIMEEIVRAKFTQHPELAARLLATGDKALVEGNKWGDTCWGVDLRTGKGENRLGKILMKIREELRAADVG